MRYALTNLECARDMHQNSSIDPTNRTYYYCYQPWANLVYLLTPLEIPESSMLHIPFGKTTDALSIKTIPKPSVDTPGEVLIKVHASASLGYDVAMSLVL